MNKRIIFVAIGAYYLGSLNLPKMAKYAYDMYVDEGFPYPKTLAGAAVVITPFTYPVAIIIQKTGYLEAAAEKMEEFNKKIRRDTDKDDQ